MPRSKMTDDQILEGLKSSYGSEITSGDVKAYCAMNSLSYPTVTRRLDSYKVSRGRWNLEVTKKTCLLYTSPSPRDKRQSRMPSSA